MAKSLVECGASKESVEELVKHAGKTYSGLCRCFWEIRRVGKARRKEVFAALRGEGLRFSGKVSGALWTLADSLQTSEAWTDAMSDKAESAARDAAKADSKTHAKKSPYESALRALEILTDFLKEDKEASESLSYIALCVDNLKGETGDAEAAPTPATLAAFNADDRELLKDFLSDVKGALKPVKTGDAEAAPTSAVA